MADIEVNVEGIYRRITYTVIVAGTAIGQERWTFRAYLPQAGGWFAGNTFESPGFYRTDAEARNAAVELVELYIDRQLSQRIKP